MYGRHLHVHDMQCSVCSRYYVCFACHMIATKATANQLGFVQGCISLYMPACLHGRHLRLCGRHNNYSLYGQAANDKHTF